jgi:hypothetical protein
MSSSIYDDHAAWHVSNMMFARVLDVAGDVGAELASTEREREWVRDLASRVSGFGTHSPDVRVADLFADAEQLPFWQVVLSELAACIYKRQIGDQSEHNWQVATIWAAVDLARVLDSSAQQLRSGGADSRSS